MSAREKKPPSRPAVHQASDVDGGMPGALQPDNIFKTRPAPDEEDARSRAATVGEDSEEASRPPSKSRDSSNRELIAEELFDEEGYLTLNPDVREAIERGECESGYAHYLEYGHAERRPAPHMPTEKRNVLLASGESGASVALPDQSRSAVEALFIAPDAGLMIVGWIDDLTHPIDCIRIISGAWRVVLDESHLIRVRRMDVEEVIDGRTSHPFGFFGMLHFEQGGDISGPVKVELWHKRGLIVVLQSAATIVTEVELRNAALSKLATSAFLGNSAIESMSYLERGVGAELIKLNRSITQRIVAAPFVERFGAHTESPRGTIIVCLYGKPEFYFIQNCLFAGLPGIEEYEFIYVSNSPELAETLLREAQSASLIYGLTNSVMILADNAGFGGANNAAARIARSDHLLMMNPDVFPRDPEWARKHTAVLDGAPREQTRLFGVPLYYDDGSLMHGGMYFELDVGVTMMSGAPTGQKILRVEHYGKGAPPDSPQFTQARPVPAITGAFFSVDRSWFEELGGFSEDFVFGHYEDADFCLRSIEKGVAPWLQDIRMWHLEGKGSARQLVHEGGSVVNRWLFSHTWTATIEAELRGPAPSHRLFRAAGSPGSAPSLPALIKSRSASRRKTFT